MKNYCTFFQFFAHFEAGDEKRLVKKKPKSAFQFWGEIYAPLFVAGKA